MRGNQAVILFSPPLPNPLPVGEGVNGTAVNADMKTIANQRYDSFNEQRRTAEARQADAEDFQELEEIAKQVGKGGNDDC